MAQRRDVLAEDERVTPEPTSVLYALRAGAKGAPIGLLELPTHTNPVGRTGVRRPFRQLNFLSPKFVKGIIQTEYVELWGSADHCDCN